MSRSQAVTESEREKALRQAGLRTASYAYENKGKQKEPDYERVIASLSDPDILAEIARGLGEDGYQKALQDEAQKRGLV